MNTNINIQASKVNVIMQLLKFEGAQNNNSILYKSTNTKFKRKFGIELTDAPIIFTAKNCIWKLSHRTHTWNGRTYEYADYLPIVGCKHLFKRIERLDINI
jgi:hypothetical protein